MEFRVLGPVELWANGKRHDLGSPKERCLLAALLWEEGRPVEADTLIRRVWGDEQPRKALSSLYSNMSRLRTSLARASGDGREWRLRHAGAYRLDAGSDVIDLFQFRRLRDEAKTAVASGDDARAFALLNEAERLWHGTPFAGLDSAWADGVRLSLTEERYSARLDRLGAGLRLGRHAELAGEAAELAAQKELDERPVEYLMRALHMSGRRAAAQQAYREFRHRCVDATGGEPGTRLRDLHQQMLRDAPELEARTPQRPALADVPIRTMPRDNPHFTGRATELGAVSAWLTDALRQSSVPVVVISGMPGVGKTALAVHAARAHEHDCPDQLYVDLRGHAPEEKAVDPGTALGTLLRALGVPDALIRPGVEDRAALWRSRLTGRRVLILLDDARDSAQVQPLLPGAPGCVVLITTRRRDLDLPGTYWLSLTPLPPEDAAMLFARTSGREQADNPEIASVLRLCDYLPLEIQIAGSEIRCHPAWRVGDLATRLREQRAEDRPVGAALALSCHYLTASQQRLLRQLALHPGPDFSRYAATALAGELSPTETRRALDGLQDYHLIEEPSLGRFSFHDLIRSYASHLAATQDSDDDRLETIRRMVDYYTWVADSAAHAIFPFRHRSRARIDRVPANPPQLRGARDHREWLESEQHTLLAVARHAAAHGLAEQAGSLAHALAWFLDARSCWTDAAELHQRAVETWHAVGNAHAEAIALIDLCRLLDRLGRYEEAFGRARQALVIARDIADRAQEAEILDNLGLIMWQTSRFPEALSHYDQALTAWRALGDRHGEAEVLSHSAAVLPHFNQHAGAVRRTEQALALYRELGDIRGEASALNNLGELQLSIEHYERALGSYQQALNIFQGIGDRLGQAATLNNIGEVARKTGTGEEALANFRIALEICRDIGNRRSEAEILNNMGSTFCQLGHYGDALGKHQQALVLAHDLEERVLEEESHRGSGDVYLAVGDNASAAVSYRAALEISQHVGDRYLEAQALHGLGRALAKAGDVAGAAEHLGKALGILTAMSKSRDADLVRDELRRLEHRAA